MEITNPSSRRLDSKSSAPKPMITQAQLAEMNRIRELEREGKTLRHEIVELLTAGAEIEAGPLTASLQLLRQQRLTWDTLADVAGEQVVAQLRREIEPTLTQILKIGEQDG